MNRIVIQGSEYNFIEKTYKINNQMSFSVNLARYIKEEQVVCLCLLKTLTVNINNKIDTFKTIDKKIKIKDYLHVAENVQLINNISLDLNNKLYYNFVAKSGGKYSRRLFIKRQLFN